jgi:chromosome segregation ATPase
MSVTEINPQVHLQELIHQNSRLQQENASLVAKVQDLIAELSAIKSFNSSSLMSSATSSPSRTDLTDIIETIKERNHQRRQELKSRHETEVRKLSTTISELKETVRSQQVKLASHSESQNFSKRKLNDLAAQRDEQGEQIAELRGLLAAAQHKLKSQKKESQHDVLNMVEQMATVRSDLEAKLATTQKQNDALGQDLEATRKQLRESRIELQMSTSAITDLRSENRGHLATIEDQGQQIQKLTAKLDRVSQERNDFATARDDLSRKLRSMSQKVSQLDQKESQLSDDGRQLKQALDELILTLENERQVHELEVVKLQSELANERTQCETIVKRLRAENARLERELWQSQHVQDTSGSKVSALAAENAKLEEKIEAAAAERKEAAAQIADLKREVSQLTQTEEELRTKLSSEVEKTRLLEESQRQDHVSQTGEIAAWRIQLQEANEKNAKLALELTEMEQRLGKEARKGESLSSRLEASTRELRDRVSEIEKMKREHSELSAELDALKRKTQDFQTTIETARRERSQLKDSLEASTKRNQALESDFKKCAAKTTEIFRGLRTAAPRGQFRCRRRRRGRGTARLHKLPCLRTDRPSRTFLQLLSGHRITRARPHTAPEASFRPRGAA